MGSVAEGLTLFGGVNVVEPDFLCSASIHDTDGVAVRDSNETAGEIVCTHVGAQHLNVKDSQRSADLKQ
jgi:hypothetical protein